MKVSCFSQEQIIGILKQHESGVGASQLCRAHGTSSATFYKWKSKYGGMDVNKAKHLRQLEEENNRLKRIVAGQALDIVVLKDVTLKK